MTRVVKIGLKLSNAYLLIGERAVLVETGSPNETASIRRVLEKEQIALDNLSLILRTHGHSGYTGSTLELSRLSKAPTAVHAADNARLRSGRNGLLSPKKFIPVTVVPLIWETYAAVSGMKFQINSYNRKRKTLFMSENLHVIFGTGPLGLSVMLSLVKRGQRVKMVNRSGNVPQGAPDHVSIVAGDAYSPEFTELVCEGADVVYQCAQPPYHEWPEKFPALQASVMEGTASAGAKFIVGENLYMYGEVDSPIHEGLPYNAHTHKGKTRAAMAEAVLSAHRSGAVRAAIGRGSDFYGPGVLDSTLGERAILPAMQGKTASLVGKLDLPHTYTYIDDFGEALVILGERQEALGQAWHVPNPPTLTQRELMMVFFKQIGKPPKMSGMGKLMMSIGGLFIPEARESAEMMYEFEKPFVVDSRKFISAFGDLATPHEQAVRETIAWYCAYFNLQGSSSICMEQVSSEFARLS